MQDQANNTIINRLDETSGFIEVVDTAPTHTPKKLTDQIKIYINGSTYRLYVYDYKNHTWRYSTLI